MGEAGVIVPFTNPDTGQVEWRTFYIDIPPSGSYDDFAISVADVVSQYQEGITPPSGEGIPTGEPTFTEDLIDFEVISLPGRL